MARIEREPCRSHHFSSRSTRRKKLRQDHRRAVRAAYHPLARLVNLLERETLRRRPSRAVQRLHDRKRRQIARVHAAIWTAVCRQQQLGGTVGACWRGYRLNRLRLILTKLLAA